MAHKSKQMIKQLIPGKLYKFDFAQYKRYMEESMLHAAPSTVTNIPDDYYRAMFQCIASFNESKVAQLTLKKGDVIDGEMMHMIDGNNDVLFYIGPSKVIKPTSGTHGAFLCGETRITLPPHQFGLLTEYKEHA